MAVEWRTGMRFTTNLFQDELALGRGRVHEGEVLEVALEVGKVRDLLQQRLREVGTQLREENMKNQIS